MKKEATVTQKSPSKKKSAKKSSPKGPTEFDKFIKGPMMLSDMPYASNVGFFYVQNSFDNAQKVPSVRQKLEEFKLTDIVVSRPLEDAETIQPQPGSIDTEQFDALKIFAESSERGKSDNDNELYEISSPTYHESLLAFLVDEPYFQ